jgi:hypothetical protein
LTVFFLQDKASLEDRRPLDLLREGKLKEVCLAAHAYADFPERRVFPGG